MDEIDLSNIDFDEDPIDEIIVQEWMHKMQRNENIPAPVLMESPRGYRVVDGIKRLKAAERLGETKFSAYIIEPVSEEKFQELRRGLNGLRKTSN